MTILRLLDLSTAHLSEQTINQLSNLAPEKFPVYGGELEHGFFLSACKDYDYHCKALPDDLLKCIRYAQASNCSHILFDCDGPTCEALPIYPHT